MGRTEKKKWLTLALCLLLLALVVIAFSFFVPIHPDVCSKNEQTGKEECAAHYIPSFILLSVLNFLEDHDGTIVAIATIFIAWFTYQLRSATVGLKDSTDRLWEAGEKQMKLVREQLDLANRQHDLQKTEYFATHRPRVTVRRMGTQVSTRNPKVITLTIVNTGGTAISSCFWVAQSMLLDGIGAMHGVPAFSGSDKDSHAEEIEAGAGINRELKSTANLTVVDIGNIDSGAKVLHVIGYVAYTDTIGVTRRTGFFRYLDRHSRRFRVVDDSEYEYQD